MNICPGATYQPIPASLFGNRARRRKGRAFVAHVAVSEALNLPPSSTSADWHFYIPKVGPKFYQYVDLDYVAYAQLDGNADCVSAETQGGVHAPDAEPWSDFEVATLAHILKYLHDSEGTPLRLMASSAASERGFGWHRLGIDPWRLPGTQKWSSSRGKLCPGTVKISQAPRIVALAAGSAGSAGTQEEDDDMPSLQEIHDAVWFGTSGAKLLPNYARAADGSEGEWAFTLLGWMQTRIAQDTAAQVAALTGEIAGLNSALEQLANAPGQAVDLAAVQEAARAGTADAIKEIDVTVHTDNG
jgi:hypothetical protein